jgi:hypothetical protein
VWTGLTPGNIKGCQGRSCALRCISLDLGCGHGLTLTPDPNLSLAERANPLAKHAIGDSVCNRNRLRLKIPPTYFSG